MLDALLLVLNTHDASDRAFAREVSAASGGFVHLLEAPDFANSSTPSGYCAVYPLLRSLYSGSDTLLLKIDDDLVYYAPGALRRLVAQRLSASNDTLLVSGNVVNHPHLAHVHQRMGLLRGEDAAAAVATADETRPAATATAPLPSAVVPPAGGELAFTYDPLSEQARIAKHTARTKNAHTAP